MSPTYIVRNLISDDIENVVDIHLQAFKDFFLSSLGRSFLKVYYKAFLNNKDAIAICITDNNNIVEGFAIGCLHSIGFHKRLLISNFFSFLFPAITILIKRPLSLIRLILNFEKNSNTIDDGKYSELLSIAIRPRNQGNGLGKDLIKKFEELAKNKGSEKITLTTDFYNNQEIILFYQKNGYKIFYDFVAYPARRMYKFYKILN